MIILLVISGLSHADPILKWRSPGQQSQRILKVSPEKRKPLPFKKLGELSWVVREKDIHRPGEIWRDPYLGMEFVWVPGGCFDMGCGAWSGSCGGDEKPVHTVCVDGFWIGRYEVTIEQYWQFLNETNYIKSGVDVSNCAGIADPEDFIPPSRSPVVCVSWYDAEAFAEWLSEKTGYTFRLPTEAEWEYACRSGGKPQKFSGGSDSAKVAWTSKYTHPVGTKAPNELGIYDMSGNVWEWCLDWYDKKYYRRSPRNNPVNRIKARNKVIRGGSWEDFAWNCRCTNRGRMIPKGRSHIVGFRLVMIPR